MEAIIQAIGRKHDGIVSLRGGRLGAGVCDMGDELHRMIPSAAEGSFSGYCLYLKAM